MLTSDSLPPDTLTESSTPALSGGATAYTGQQVVLHQFAISHFCEKVRWALAIKGINHRLNGVMPGPHAKAMQKLSGQRSVPVLEVALGVALHESSRILDWIDEAVPEPRLSPVEPVLAAEARAWELRLDEALGTHVRRLAYNTLLEHKPLMIRLLGHAAPWYGKPMLWVIFGKIEVLMRKGFGITPENVAASEQQIESVLRELAVARGDGLYLVGERFTRADLTAASMLAPLTMEPRYGVPWPAEMPAPLGPWADSLELDWVSELYRLHRPASDS